jgi:hypothetical protein
VKKRFIYRFARRLFYRRGVLQSIRLIPLLAGVMYTAPAHAGIVDLGTVAVSTQLNATITDSNAVGSLLTYSYTQLRFVGGSQSLTFDNNQTVSSVLANDLGAVDPGSLSYNFPSPFGASGTYSQLTPNTSPNIGVLLAFTVTSVSGHVYSGFNSVGAAIMFDPTNAAMTYSTILGNRSGIGSGGAPIPSTTVTTLTLGRIGANTYIGESADTTWQTTNQFTSTSPTPEPSTLWLGAVALTGLNLWRKRRKAG